MQKNLSNSRRKNRLSQKAQTKQRYFLKTVLFFCTTLPSIVYGGQHLYVVDGVDGQVRVIDTHSNNVVRMFNAEIGQSPNEWPFVAFTPDGEKAFITNPTKDSISVINIPQGTITQISEGIGIAPSNIAMTPDGKTAYILNMGGAPGENSSVSWIDTKSYQAGQITDNIGPASFSIAVTPDGSKAYVINAGEGESGMSWIDLASKQAHTIDMIYGHKVPVPFSISPMAITSDSGHVYAGSLLNSDNPVISVIDTETNRVVDAIDGFMPFVIALTPDGKNVIAASVVEKNNNFPAIGVIDVETNELLEIITAPEEEVGIPFCIAITPDGRKAYITYPTGNKVMAFDIATNTLIAIDRAGQQTPMYIAITPDSKKAYITNKESQNILVIDTATDQGEVISSDIGQLPIGLFIAPSPLPPIPMTGYQKKDRFLTETDLINVIRWKTPPKQGPLPVRYAVYRDANLTELIGTVSAPKEGDIVSFKDHNCEPHRAYTYYVISIDESGSASPPVEVIFSPTGKE